MKELKFTETTTAPLWLKDLEYLQQGCNEGIKSIAKGLSFDTANFIISGCKIIDNGTYISMSGGWCFYEGEILCVNQLPKTRYSTSNPKIKFTKQKKNYPEGDRMVTYRDKTALSQVYVEYYLEPSLVNDGDDYILAISQGAWNLGDRISNSAKMLDSGVQRPTACLTNLSGDVQYRQIGGTVQLYGYVKSLILDTAPLNVPFAKNLPKPITDVVIPIGNCRITISIDGYLYVTSDEPIIDNLYLNGIVYLSTPSNNSNDNHYTTEISVKDMDDLY